eukprot:4538634-Pleurochrysis_carterae.AAC.1
MARTELRAALRDRAPPLQQRGAQQVECDAALSAVQLITQRQSLRCCASQQFYNELSPRCLTLRVLTWRRFRSCPVSPSQLYQSDHSGHVSTLPWLQQGKRELAGKIHPLNLLIGETAVTC